MGARFESGNLMRRAVSSAGATDNSPQRKLWGKGPVTGSPAGAKVRLTPRSGADVEVQLISQGLRHGLYSSALTGWMHGLVHLYARIPTRSQGDPFSFTSVSHTGDESTLLKIAATDPFHSPALTLFSCFRVKPKAPSLTAVPVGSWNAIR